MKRAPAKTMIILAALLLIVAEGFSLLYSISSLASGTFFSTILARVFDRSFSSLELAGLESETLIAGVVFIVQGIVSFICGLICLRNAGVPARSKRIIAAGIVLIAWQILTLIAAVILGSLIAGGSYLTRRDLLLSNDTQMLLAIPLVFLSSLVLPILLVIGGNRNWRFYLQNAEYYQSGLLFQVPEQPLGQPKTRL